MLVPAFIQDPDNVTIVHAESRSKIPIFNDLYVRGLVSALKGKEMKIQVFVEAKRRLHWGLFTMSVFDLSVWCPSVTFTAPTDGEDSRDWMSLGGTLYCY
ncbi:hypothetical protein ACJRO7_026663 [Eucalyptus globulus]|uniref:Neurotransmitter-gated ion-channel ligand-binding domain-containing protein n=1 Tax=Eucalyptus globulus TaxID=34317 RepID=A0ABD3JQ70_EUCGL